MASKTFTIDTNEWKYPDIFGITHTVTNAETFQVDLTDKTTVGATYNMSGNNLACTDGHRIYIEKGNGKIYLLSPTDAKTQGAADRNCRGEIEIRCPVTDVKQVWKPSMINIDDVDAPTAIWADFEDQFGHKFSWSNVTIA